jgi:hypothetical protein
MVHCGKSFTWWDITIAVFSSNCGGGGSITVESAVASPACFPDGLQAMKTAETNNRWIKSQVFKRDMVNGFGLKILK